MHLFMILIYLILAVIGISFAALNAASVKVNFYFATWTLPLSILIIAVFGLGLILGFILFLGRYWRLKRDCNRTKNQLKLTEREIKNLRDIPLKDSH